MATSPVSRVFVGLLLLGGAGLGCNPARGSEDAPSEAALAVRVRLFNDQGQLVGPVTVPRIERSAAEWRRLLTPQQFRVCRQAGTERAGSGSLLGNEKQGVYACVGCRLPLFASDAKFDSGTGWPSYFQPIAPENVAERPDFSHGMVRTENYCPRCETHLGHVFADGPPPNHLRYCINSAAMTFVPREEVATLAEPAANEFSARGDRRAPENEPVAQQSPGHATAVFGGGCFWCVEAVFQQLDGVHEVVSGYAGGTAETATYEQVVAGRTNHAEVVRITYDPNRITYEALLRVHFATHFPTQLNRQGPDVGRQYRSAIFYASDEEKRAAEAFIKKLTEQGEFNRPIVTTLEPLDAFYEAEPYHQDFAARNASNPYIRRFTLPKLEKVREKFPEKIKSVSANDAR